MGVALGAWLALKSRSLWIILNEDSIEIGGIFKPDKIARTDIVERKLYNTGRGSYYILILRNAKKVRLPMFMRYDRLFYAWMEPVPLAKPRRRKS
jgi:hypothetical protein